MGRTDVTWFIQPAVGQDVGDMGLTPFRHGDQESRCDRLLFALCLGLRIQIDKLHTIARDALRTQLTVTLSRSVRTLHRSVIGDVMLFENLTPQFQGS